MGNGQERNRNYFWWQTGVSPDDEAEIGGRMMRTVAIWFAVLFGLAVLFVLVVTLA